MTDRVWKYADEFNLPRVVVLNQMDHPRAAAVRRAHARGAHAHASDAQ